MKKALFIIGTVVLFSACQSKQNEQSKADSLAIDTSITPITQQLCYLYTKNKDTAKLTLITTGAVVTGELNYNLYEKDKNTGIFEGEMHGDTLFADYTFKSEGMESVRQAVFLKRGNQLEEGFGDIEEKNGKTVFKNKTKLTFGQSIIFNKVDCQ